MGEWVTGAVINVFGSIGINFGTNLLKLGHNQRERLALLEAPECGEKSDFKSIIHFQSWRVGMLIFALGNCLNFISFGYAAQSLLAALGSVQFISNVAFAYFVLEEKVTGRVLLATALIVFGNIFLVGFGNHQSPVFTPEQLMDKYTNHIFLLYCLGLLLIVALNHSLYRYFFSRVKYFLMCVFGRRRKCSTYGFNLYHVGIIGVIYTCGHGPFICIIMNL